MTLPRLATHLLLRPEDVPPSRDDFEVVGVFNPGVMRLHGEIVLLVRVAERPRERRAGFTPLPRWDQEAGLTVDWVPNSEVVPIDPRVFRRLSTGVLRLAFTSHLRVVRCGDGRSVNSVTQNVLLPAAPTEEFGVEDPRITPIDGRFYITYVAVSRHGPATALASTVDFVNFERHGIIFCAENKDVVIFPERIDDAYVALHRPVCGTPFAKPEMWIARSPDLTHWGQHQPLKLSSRAWTSGRVGAGAPPFRVSEGWLEIYHGNREPEVTGSVGMYYGGVLLLDAADPGRVLKQGRDPILHPVAAFEQQGFVPDVVFPTGVVAADDRLLVFYGAADTCVGMVELSRDDLMAALEPAVIDPAPPAGARA